MTGPEYLKHTSSDTVNRREILTDMRKKGKSKRTHRKSAQTSQAKSIVKYMKGLGF